MNEQKDPEEIKQKDEQSEANENNTIIEKKKKSVLRYIIRVAIIFIILAVFYTAILMIEKVQVVNSIFQNLEDEEISLTEYLVYGTHLNIKGNLKINDENISNVRLCFKSVNNENLEDVSMNFTKTADGISFYTSNLINEGIDLEKFDVGMYYVFVKVISDDGLNRIYTIKNTTRYDNIDYYTITKNGKNKRIDIKFGIYSLEEIKKDYMCLNVNFDKLPEDVYDIVIDPGHGGKDVGAEANGYREANLALKFATKVKRELEASGFKVKITRDGTEGDEYNVYTVYDKNGRVNVTGASKAKYVFSIHLNSIEIPNSQKGVEIYAPTKINLNMAKAFADNIVKYGKTNYSTLGGRYNVANGVYVRTFTEKGIQESIKEANKKGYKPYDIKQDTPYLYMLRETGGIATGAYVDGRNPDYGKNMYYDSNIGLEAYLLELGYINNRSDLQNMLINEDGYVEGIVKTIEDEIFGRI